MRANWCGILIVLFLLSSEASAETSGRHGYLSTIWFLTGLFVIMTMLLSGWKTWLALVVWVPSALSGAGLLFGLYYPGTRPGIIRDLGEGNVDHAYAAATIQIAGPIAIFIWRLMTRKRPIDR